MKRRDLEFETLVREALKGKKVPILVLDRRWHTLFPQGEKPAEIIQLEEKLNELLKRQGYLVNDIKDLKKTKKKFLFRIIMQKTRKKLWKVCRRIMRYFPYQVY